MLRYLRIYSLLLRNSLIREMSFKANFLLWTVVEVLWFLGQVLFIDVLFAHIETLGDWTKWQVVALVGTHQVVSQVFQAFFYVNLTQIPELVRTGKLDVYLTLPVDSQFAVSSKQFGVDNLVNVLIGLAITGFALSKLNLSPSLGAALLYGCCVLLGVAVHYSVMCSLSCLCFWIIRAQGLVYGYFNLFNIGRYPDSVFRGAFRWVFTWIVPVILVANVPARVLTDASAHPFNAVGQLAFTSALLLGFTRWLWLRGLARYSSASS
jgi:ABC-2 type transport system permease protein